MLRLQDAEPRANQLPPPNMPAPPGSQKRRHRQLSINRIDPGRDTIAIEGYRRVNLIGRMAEHFTMEHGSKRGKSLVRSDFGLEP